MADEKHVSGEHGSPDAMVIDIAIRLGLLALLAYWSLTVIGPFLVIVTWAVILAVAIYPFHRWLTLRLGGRKTAASLLITVIGLALVFGPTAALAFSMFESVQSVMAGLRDGTISVPAPSESVRAWPVIGENLFEAWSLAATNLKALVSAHREVVLSTGGTLLARLAGVATGILAIAGSVIVAGFLYGHGPALGASLHRIAKRIAAERGDAFVDLAGATIRNVARGVIGVSMLQALLAGTGLLIAGVPAAGLITFGVLILSVIQIGPGILILPVVIWVWTTMDTITALIFTVYMVPVSLVDNVLKPAVMSRGLHTPMVVIFVGVVGGTLSHGLIGLFVGPIVLSVLYDLIRTWVATETSVKAPVDQGSS